METGSSSALVFPGEVFVHSSVTECILSVDTVPKNVIQYHSRHSSTEVCDGVHLIS